MSNCGEFQDLSFQVSNSNIQRKKIKDRIFRKDKLNYRKLKKVAMNFLVAY